MQHFPRRTVRQAALRRVGDGIGAMHKNMVPRLVTIGLGTIAQVPVGVGLARQINSDDHTAITVAHVFHKVTGHKH